MHLMPDRVWLATRPPNIDKPILTSIWKRAESMPHSWRVASVHSSTRRKIGERAAPCPSRRRLADAVAGNLGILSMLALKDMKICTRPLCQPPWIEIVDTTLPVAAFGQALCNVETRPNLYNRRS